MMKKTILVIGLLISLLDLSAAKSVFFRQAIFEPQPKHAHASSLVELANGDLLACWFFGSGERTANDVKIMGSRLKKGRDQWAPVFEMADTPDLPDCNPVLFLNDGKLFLFWIIVYENKWQNSLIACKTSRDFLDEGAPKWGDETLLRLAPGEEFKRTLEKGFREIRETTQWDPVWAEYARPYDEQLIAAAGDEKKTAMGWMTRIHPCKLSSGRILLPLYSDGFNIGLMAISDDGGDSWRPSHPIVGLGLNQPSVVEKKDGTLVAYMRNDGETQRIPMSTSADRGETWSTAVDTDLPNPGASIEVMVLRNGDWLLIFNDTTDRRNRLSAALSDDEGQTWKWKRAIVDSESHSYTYPSVIQSVDGMIRLTFSCAENGLETIDYVYFNPDWIKDSR